MNPFDLNPLKMVNPFSSEQMGQISQTADKLKQLKVLDKLYPYFNITTDSILKRLQLMFFPFISFQKRCSVQLDIYLPLMGHLLYVVVSSYVQALTEVEFSTQVFSKMLGYSAILFIMHTTATYIVGKTLPNTTIYDHFAQNGYNFVYAGLLAIFKQTQVLFWIMFGYCVACTVVHSLQLGIMRVKEHSDQNLSSSAQIAAQNLVVLVLAGVQGLVLAFLVWIV
ncbi:Yif1 [Hexamita inflata]|uniref:Protein YIF1 n=1 Tax=Hexamita inflata TaxID=28002 RepID=A0AA86U179_9EUKA|nr:Yif1 [Hexamita inflata]